MSFFLKIRVKLVKIYLLMENLGSFQTYKFKYAKLGHLTRIHGMKCNVSPRRWEGDVFDARPKLRPS